MQLELKQVLDAVEKEKNIDRQMLIGALREALMLAAKRFYGECSFEVIFNEEIREFELLKYRTVVEDKSFTDKLRQISLTDAIAESLKQDPDSEPPAVGDEMGEHLSTDALGRIAAQSAKQVIVQKMAEAEKDKILRDFKEKRHQLVTGIVKRFDKQDLIIDLGACDGVLPHREQIPGEKYKIKDKVLCYVADVKKGARGAQIILSRADPEMLVRLFEQEVTEINEGNVIIQSAARDPGSRSKIAVFSTETSIDPVGACVGMKGARVQSIVQELRGEKVDIILYDRDPAHFVCNALAPAEVSKVIVNERTHTMEVVVPDEQLSLAIGKRGQNVRLAAQLTGWKVDIRSEAKMKELMLEYRELLAQIPYLGEMRAEILVNEGYKDPADVARMDPKSLVRLLRLSVEESEKVIQYASELAENIHAKNIQQEQDDYDINSLVLSTVIDENELSNATEEEAAIENLVSKVKLTPLLDPEKVDIKQVSRNVLTYWMVLKGVGEHTSAVLHVAGFTDYDSVIITTVEDIAYKTGLPVKFCGKIHAEITKRFGNK